MQVTVELPDPKPTGLEGALAKQFADIQRQLLQLVEAKEKSSQAMHTMMMECLEEQQTTLVSALERLMGMMGKMPHPSAASDALVDSVRGLKQTMASLPGELKDALDRQYQHVQTKLVKGETRPSVTVRMPQGLMSRIDSLEAALLQGLKRSRSRTFGSNY